METRGRDRFAFSWVYVLDGQQLGSCRAAEVILLFLKLLKPFTKLTGAEIQDAILASPRLPKLLLRDVSEQVFAVEFIFVIKLATACMLPSGALHACTLSTTGAQTFDVTKIVMEPWPPAGS